MGFFNEDYHDKDTVDFSELKGKTIKSIKGLENGSDDVTIICTDGTKYTMRYYDDCCARCSIEDICGDVKDLIGSEILLAEEVSSTEPKEEVMKERRAQYEKEKQESGENFYYENFENWHQSSFESETWCFYKAATIKGSVTIRWYGSSNGYYSESATFERWKK